MRETFGLAFIQLRRGAVRHIIGLNGAPVCGRKRDRLYGDVWGFVTPLEALRYAHERGLRVCARCGGV